MSQRSPRESGVEKEGAIAHLAALRVESSHPLQFPWFALEGDVIRRRAVHIRGSKETIWSRTSPPFGSSESPYVHRTPSHPRLSRKAPPSPSAAPPPPPVSPPSPRVSESTPLDSPHPLSVWFRVWSSGLRMWLRL